jgi:hypothetical protein
MQHYYQAPRIRDYFDVATSGDTLIARLQEDRRESVELRLQKIVMSPDSSHFRYIESQFGTDYWLYSTEVHIRVQFDSAGYYQHHRLRIHAQVLQLENSFDARIEGQMSP